MQDEKPSAPDEIALPTRLVTLPEPGPRGPIRLLIAYVDPAELLTLMGGLPSFAGAPKAEGAAALEQTRRLLVDSDVVAQKVAERAVLEPRFWFDQPEAGKASWAALTLGNRLAVVRLVSEFAGLAVETRGTEEAAAAAVGTFPQQPGG